MNPLPVGQIVTVSGFHFDNDLGGTETAKLKASVKVVRSWHDYECGWRGVGTLVDEAMMLKIKEKAKTPHKPKAKSYDPWKVYVSEFDLVNPRIVTG